METPVADATPTQHSTVLSLPITEIKEKDRIRTQIGNVEELACELRDNGQQNPITFEIIDGERVLNTGSRRYLAAGLLASRNEFIGMKLPEGHPRRVNGLAHILARNIGDLDPIERLTLEISENKFRKEFTQAEEALGYAKLQRLIEEKEQRPVRVTELAERLNLSVGQVGMGLKVAQFVESNPESAVSKKIMKANSVKAGYDQLRTHQRLDELMKRASKTREVAPFEKAIANSDGLAFLKSLPDASVDFINFDPPWGVGIDDYDRHHKHENFDDSPEYAWEHVILPMIPEMYRVLKDNTWSIVWFGIQYYERLTQALTTLSGTVKPGLGFRVDPVPNIWTKPNKGGSQNNPDVVELNVYEPYFRIRKGDPRLFKKAVKNQLDHPMDSGASRDHFAQKPVALMKDILERYTFSNMHVIDPTYGSGRFFKAAQALGRTFAGAEKSATNREKTLTLLRTA